MKVEAKLARAFQSLAQQGQQLDTVASGVLAIVKSAGAITEASFNALVEKAYTANGWNTKPGRPANGEAKTAAPNTVRTYVDIVRRAIRVGMRVTRYPTFTALRTALERKIKPRAVHANGKRNGKAAVSTIARIPKDVQNDFVGVAIDKPRDANGALFHDLGATFIRLKETERAEMGRELSALLHKWLPRAGVPTLAQRKAA